MRIGEILRKVADLADQAEQAEQGQAVVQAEPIAAPEPIAATPEPAMDVTATVTQLVPVDTDEKLDPETATMVTPLQQEHELLKKSQGVENNVAEFASQEGDDYNNELSAMKRSAGIGEEQQGPVDHAQDLKPVSINPRAVAATEANHGEPDPRLQQTQRRNK